MHSTERDRGEEGGRRLAMGWFLLVSVALFVATACVSARAAGAEQEAQRLKWWRNARFGMFIHWGVYSVPAGVWDGEEKYAEWIRHRAQIPVDRYEELAQDFNPTEFDANRWARFAEQAGMKYMVITSKHHDGFCLFDSDYTEWDIGEASPYGGEPLEQLADACRDRGIRFATYYSIMDWHHPDYLPRRSWSDRSAKGADMDRYTEYAVNQVGEIIERLDPAIIWFDGGWEDSWTEDRGRKMLNFVREKAPHTIINDRLEVNGDYITPEQHIPTRGPERDWETCMTMNNHWGYAKYDNDWKSTKTLIRNLVDIVSKGGNYLLNVGPKADGTFPDPAIKRLKEIGEWMDTYGESIYGTDRSPMGEPAWGRCTAEPGRLYLHVFRWPDDGTLEVPRLRNEVEAAYLLGEDEDLETVERDRGVAVRLTGADAPNAIDTVVVLEIEGTPDIAPPPPIDVDEDGASLPAVKATIHGSQARLEERGGESNVGYWLDPSDYVTWNIKASDGGQYRVKMSYACPQDSVCRITVDGQELTAELPSTGKYTTFETRTLGTVKLEADAEVTVTAHRTEDGGPYNLRSLEVIPAE